MRNVVTFIIFALIGILTVLFALRSGKGPELPVLGEAPQFTLTADDSNEFSSKSFDGEIWVASFFFSSCPHICPAVNGRLSALAKEEPNLKIASITVDPKRDTPEALSKYASRFRSNASQWKFLTGENSKIRSLLDDGFKVASRKEADLHSTRLILVDRDAKIRGYYRGTDSEEFKKLKSDAHLLLRK